MKEMEELLNMLGLNLTFDYDGSTLVATIPDSNTYSKVYSVLDKSDLVDLDPEYTSMTTDKVTLVYLSDDFKLTLEGNLEDNLYALYVEDL